MICKIIILSLDSCLIEKLIRFTKTEFQGIDFIKIPFHLP